MRLTVLSVNYPLAAASPDSSGGAEQVLCMLDRALVQAGHRSIVIAPAGSRVQGTLVPIGPEPVQINDAERLRAHEETRAAIAGARERWPVDLVHLHGIDFYEYMPPPGVRVLATLHLPVGWYPWDAVQPTRPQTWVNCVSAAQHANCPPSPALLPPIDNGVPTQALQARHAKRRFALFLGRICPEKGVHLAIEAAKRAGIPLLIAGQLFPYQDHQNYFASEVLPRLDAQRRYIGPIGFERKRRLLTAAQCLLAPFLAEETSSLVTREAIACGTPVIAYANGALKHSVLPGATGFLVGSMEAMADAIPACQTLDPAFCRAVARRDFSEERMTAAYLKLYGELVESSE